MKRCIFGLISVVVITSTANVLSAQPQRSLVVLPAVHQNNSPIQLQKVTSTIASVVDRAQVMSASTKAIAAFTLGVYYRPLGSANTQLSLAETGQSLTMTLNPGQKTDVQLYMSSPAAVLEKTSGWGTDVVAEVGVVTVDFQDGTRFEYDPDAHSGFTVLQVPSVKSVACRVDQRPPAKLASNRWARSFAANFPSERWRSIP